MDKIQSKTKIFTSNKRLRLKIDELLVDVNDFMWLWHGWPIWIYRKIIYAPNTVTTDDRRRIRQLLTEQIPDAEQLAFVRRMIETQLPSNDERKNRIEKLDRAIANTELGRSFLIELIRKIDENLAKRQQQIQITDNSNDQPAFGCQKLKSNKEDDCQKYSAAANWKSITEMIKKQPRSFRSQKFNRINHH